MTKPLLLLFLAVLSRSLGAAEINGVVQQVSGKTASVRVQGEQMPVVDDKAVIFFKLAGAEDEISVATGRVEKINGDVVELKIEEATGDVGKDQLVRIKSEKPQKRTTAGGSPTSKSAPPDSRLAAKCPEYLEARKLAEKGDPDGALALLDVAIRKFPDEPALYFNHALCFWDKADWDKCVADAERVIALTDDNPKLQAEAYSLRGVAERKQRNFSAALESQNRSIALYPTARAYSERAYARGILSQFDANLLDDCNHAIELDPNDAFSHFLRGGYRLRTGAKDAAAADWAKAVALDSTLEEAVRKDREAVEQADKFGTRLVFNKGELYYTATVTQEEATKLGNFLVKEEFFNGDKKSALLNKEGETYVFRMVVQKGKERDPQVEKAAKTFAGQMSRELFNRAETIVHLCNDSFRTLKVISTD